MRKIFLVLVFSVVLTNTVGAQTGADGKPQLNSNKSGGEQNIGGESAELATARELSATAVKLYNEGKFEEAIVPAKRALELREQALGTDHILVSSSLTTLAVIYLEKKKNDEAELLYKRALEILEKNGEGETERAAAVINELGVLRFKRGDYSQTENLLARALAIREKVHGAEHPGIVQSLFNLASFYSYRDHFANAEPLYERAVAILEKQPPHKNPAAVEALRQYICTASANRSKSLAPAFVLIPRLEHPEEAAERERKSKETKEKGEMTLVKGEVLNGRAVSKPAPSYPAEAKRARVSGMVVVSIVVDEDGKVIKAEAFCGHPVLAKASVEAARQARFTPTLLSGQPVKVSGIITYNFVLQ